MILSERFKFLVQVTKIRLRGRRADATCWSLLRSLGPLLARQILPVLRHQYCRRRHVGRMRPTRALPLLREADLWPPFPRWERWLASSPILRNLRRSLHQRCVPPRRH